MIPKYVLWSFILLAVFSIRGGRMPLHPLIEIQCILYTILAYYPLKVFYKNYGYLKAKYKFYTYLYCGLLIACVAGLIRLCFQKNEGILPFDIYMAITSILSMGWIFVAIKNKNALSEIIKFSLKNWMLVWLLLMLPFYNIGFLRSYLYFLLPFIVFFQYSTNRTRIPMILFLIFFFMYPGQRLDFLSILTMLSLILVDRFTLLNTQNIAKYYSILFLTIPFISIALYLTLNFSVLDFESYISTHKNYGEENLFDDTRTFLYIESIQSLKSHGTWLLGETPAFGYDSMWRTENLQSIQILSRFSECAIINIYVWFGLIGFIGYTWLFVKTVKIAIKSPSLIINLLGSYIAIYYALCWIGNCNNWITNQDIILYLFIGFILQSSKKKMKPAQIICYFKYMLKN